MTEARLLTLNELAEASGLSVDAIRKRIRRGQIRPIRGNDGLVRVRLDDQGIEAMKAGVPSRSPYSRPASRPVDEAALISELRADKATLRERLDKAEAKIEALTAELREVGEARAAAEATAMARLEEIERQRVGVLVRLQEAWRNWRAS